MNPSRQRILAHRKRKAASRPPEPAAKTPRRIGKIAHWHPSAATAATLAAMFSQEPATPLAAAIAFLQGKGHRVSPAERVPGLYHLDGKSPELTTNQVIQLAAEAGFA